ncbi:MAG: alpha/beta hydrolase [Deltaproteobacteria bacterium]|nr:alpha/beta hydrolase [Deltaproteobacteria bacterium]
MPKIKANGLMMNYEEHGAGNPGTPIVLLHGITQNAQWQAPFAKVLARRRHVYCLDWVGHGGTDRRDVDGSLDQSYSLESIAWDIRAWLDIMRLNKVVLAGHSLGGMICQVFARRFSDRVDNLILICTGVGTVYTPMQNFLRAIATLGLALKTLWGLGLPKDRLKREWNEKYEYTVKHTNLNTTVIKRCLAQIEKKRFHSEPWLHELEMPTLVIGAEADRSTTFAPSEILDRELPCSTLYVARGQEHDCHLLDPEGIGAVVLDFLA